MISRVTGPILPPDRSRSSFSSAVDTVTSNTASGRHPATNAPTFTAVGTGYDPAPPGSYTAGTATADSQQNAAPKRTSTANLAASSSSYYGNGVMVPGEGPADTPRAEAPAVFPNRYDAGLPPTSAATMMSQAQAANGQPTQPTPYISSTYVTDTAPTNTSDVTLQQSHAHAELESEVHQLRIDLAKAQGEVV
jgi:hypothetical protein